MKTILNKIKVSSVKVLAVGMIAAMCSCDDQMNYTEYTIHDKAEIESEFTYVGGVVATIYRQLDYDYGQNCGGAMLASATDESEYAIQGNDIETYYNGGWSPSNPMSTMWTSMYLGISYCNLYLDQFTGLTFPELEMNLDYDKQMHRYNNYQYEVRWARAYFYFNLLRQYGGVPLVTSNISVEESNGLSRATADEVFNFIKTECDAIKDSIIADYNNDAMMVEAAETGRADKLAVLALKARAALYHASPLFNTSNDQTLWREAAIATKELIDAAEARGMGLADSYEGLWATENYQNSDASSEIILGRRIGDISTPESYNFPVGIEGGKGGNCPTQNLVDAYDEGDERFEATIAKNGDTGWPSSNGLALETYYGGVNAEPLTGGTPTSYYLKKHCHAAISLAASSKYKEDKHTWTIFRMGEFYLNYAEAVYKYLGSPTATSSDLNISAIEAMNKTRERAGLDGVATTLSNDEFWEAYKKERMVELAFEGHRFWDVRRWKEADKYFTSIREQKLTLNADGTISSSINTVSRTWNDKMYLYPIPQTEMMKNPNLTQNPGWE